MLANHKDVYSDSQFAPFRNQFEDSASAKVAMCPCALSLRQRGTQNGATALHGYLSASGFSPELTSESLQQRTSTLEEFLWCLIVFWRP